VLSERPSFNKPHILGSLGWSFFALGFDLSVLGCMGSGRVVKIAWRWQRLTNLAALVSAGGCILKDLKPLLQSLLLLLLLLVSTLSTKVHVDSHPVHR
jgi:hypothetical protein